MSNLGIITSETFKKDGHAMVRLQCVECKEVFERRAAEVKRNNKRGFEAFCSMPCSAKYGNRRRVYDDRPEEHRDSYWTPFYLMVSQSKKNSKSKKHDSAVTPEDIEYLWRLQDGKCALSGIPMYLPENRRGFKKRVDRVSLDRIDSTGDYEPANIQLITCMANYCKHTWSNDDVVEFAQAVTTFQHRT